MLARHRVGFRAADKEPFLNSETIRGMSFPLIVKRCTSITGHLVPLIYNGADQCL
jgi:hypothetical protein